MKTISQICMAIMLSLSIMAPAVMEIVDVDLGIEISQNLGEEETEKEGENKLEELEEKKLIVLSLEFGAALDPSSIKENSFHYQENRLELVRSIVLPPPEQL